MSVAAHGLEVRPVPKLALLAGALAAVAAVGAMGLRARGPTLPDHRRSPAGTGTQADDDALSIGWAGDVDTFVASLEAVHPEPYHSITRQEFLAEVVEFKTALPDLTEWEARTRFMALLALLSREGQDGHMVLRPMDTSSTPWRVLPLEVYWFPDGLHVVAGHSADARDLVGAKLLAVGGMPVGEIVDLLESIITKDNEWTAKARVPTMMLMPDVLGALGVANASSVDLLQDGKRVTVTLEPLSMSDYLERTGRMHPFIARLPHRPGHMWLNNVNESISVRHLSGPNAVYVGFNLVHAPFDAAIRQIDTLMETERPNRVVVDIRNNPGGETGQYPPLLKALSESPVDRPGRLFVLTSRVTFSAAANFLGDLDQEACVLVIGEPPGAAPRFWNDNDPITLPYSGLQVGVAERWWDQGGREHPGEVFELDARIALRAKDYFAGSDPVLLAALHYPVSPACS